MRLLFNFTKEGVLRFISHLDLQRLFIRAFRRANLSIAMKGGFNPQPKLSFASALPLGYTSVCEYLEAEIMEPLTPQEVRERLLSQLPQGICINHVEEISLEKTSLMSRLNSAEYLIKFKTAKPLDKKDLEYIVEKFLKKEEAIITRRSKKKIKKINVIPFLIKIEVLSMDSSYLGEIRAHIKAGPGGSVKPLEILDLLMEEHSLEILERKAHREKLFIQN
ncbi:TIGR03936 family radical SAM-associated protein [Candidatus Contubernalis alkaliaceticus]|uniref:TIGR03936 family radical SAM-associated protein n=1 Tax=Candidatus Contubernalis alkaliaceticus TaxID=338645 RepID=UPI001F4BCFE2|nr:TIGR03936 family radical SAM-associated protein [Candidatus Contubernalis alkalaceticus]UNC90927.1 DUF2344 domain-containing protein [Candidatus Contubernalis alkalaceticus]